MSFPWCKRASLPKRCGVGWQISRPAGRALVWARFKLLCLGGRVAVLQEGTGVPSEISVRGKVHKIDVAILVPIDRHDRGTGRHAWNLHIPGVRDPRIAPVVPDPRRVIRGEGLPGRPTSVYHKIVPGHVARCLGSEENNWALDIIYASFSTHGAVG